MICADVRGVHEGEGVKLESGERERLTPSYTMLKAALYKMLKATGHAEEAGPQRLTHDGRGHVASLREC